MPSPHATVRRTPFEGHDRESRPPGIPDALQAGFRRGAGPYRDTSEGAVGDGEGRKSAEVGLQAGGQLGWEPRQRPPRGVGIEPQGTVLGQGVALSPIHVLARPLEAARHGNAKWHGSGAFCFCHAVKRTTHPFPTSGPRLRQGILKNRAASCWTVPQDPREVSA